MGAKLFAIGWILTKYLTIPIITLSFSIWFLYFVIEVIKATHKKLNE